MRHLITVGLAAVRGNSASFQFQPAPATAPPPSPHNLHARVTASSFQNSFGSQRHKILKSHTNTRDQLVHFLIIFFLLLTGGK